AEGGACAARRHSPPVGNTVEMLSTAVECAPRRAERSGFTQLGEQLGPLRPRATTGVDLLEARAQIDLLVARDDPVGEREEARLLDLHVALQPIGVRARDLHEGRGLLDRKSVV